MEVATEHAVERVGAEVAWEGVVVGAGVVLRRFVVEEDGLEEAGSGGEGGD